MTLSWAAFGVLGARRLTPASFMTRAANLGSGLSPVGLADVQAGDIRPRRTARVVYPDGLLRGEVRTRLFDHLCRIRERFLHPFEGAMLAVLDLQCFDLPL